MPDGHAARPALAAVPTLTGRVVQDGLTIPWDVAFAPGGQMFVTERPGRVRVFRAAAERALIGTTTIATCARRERPA